MIRYEKGEYISKYVDKDTYRIHQCLSSLWACKKWQFKHSVYILLYF